jgi:hypothetical protein
MMALLWLTLIQALKIRFVLADVGASYSPGSANALKALRSKTPPR